MIQAGASPVCLHVPFGLFAEPCCCTPAPGPDFGQAALSCSPCARALSCPLGAAVADAAQVAPPGRGQIGTGAAPRRSAGSLCWAAVKRLGRFIVNFRNLLSTVLMPPHIVHLLGGT